MKILYLTTSLLEEDYDTGLKKGFSLPNPSNQNFHSRLVKTLMEKENVQVLSLVNKNASKTVFISSKNYHYINHDPLSFLFGGSVQEIVYFGLRISKNDGTIVIFDSLNIHLAKAAMILGRKLHAKTVAILTDNPKNLANKPWIYRLLFGHYVSKANAYLSLSEGLLKAIAPSQKPSFVFEGIVEEESAGKPLYAKGSYIYFGGALSSRYGIQNLIIAYGKTAMDYDLLLAGHGESPEFLSLIQTNPRIRFLGQVSRKENINLEENAVLLVNPRPFDATLDRESVPSKLLEYLVSGTPILSVIHSRLKGLFPKDVAWLPLGSEEEIEAYFKAHRDSKGHFFGLQENHGREKALALYGMKALGERLHDFLNDLN